MEWSRVMLSSVWVAVLGVVLGLVSLSQALDDFAPAVDGSLPQDDSLPLDNSAPLDDTPKAPEVDIFGELNITLYNSGALGYSPNQTYRSTPIVAPIWGVNVWDAEYLGETSAPFLFITSTEPNTKPAPYIFNATDLSLVWADTEGTSRKSAMNFRPQPYRGTNYLAFWEGNKISGRGKGACVLYDHSYRQRHVITTQHIGINADLHECKLTDDGTALVTAYNWVQWNLTSIGGKDDDWMMNCFFQEIDVETGEVLFSWSATEWFQPEDSFEKYNKHYDFFHLNSVQKVRDGNYLISSRHLHMIALIGGNNAERRGKPIWMLGGKHNMFEDISDGLALDFSWQHHARFRNDENTELTFFDNHHSSNRPGHTGCSKDCSSGKSLWLDYEHMTARLGAAFLNPHSLQSGSMGNIQALASNGVPGGNYVVGWGSNPAITEYTQEGRCVMDIQFGPFDPGYKFGKTVASYRAYKGDWLGMPLTDPDISTDWATQRVYVSWNGATEVRSWAVYVGDDQGAEIITVDYLKTVAKRGFETEIPVDRFKWIQIRALDASGQTLKKTPIWDYEHNIEVNEFRREMETEFIEPEPPVGAGVGGGDANVQPGQR